MTELIMKSEENPYRPDILIFAIAIPLISAFNYYLTYSDIRLSWFLVLTFSIDTVQGYCAWWAVRMFIRYLDKKLPFREYTTRRLVLQLTGTLFIGLVIISSLTELVSWIAKGRPAPLSFYTVDLFIIAIWFFVINGVYIGLYYYNLYRSSEERLRKQNEARTGFLVVRQGKADLKIPYEDIGGFFLDAEYVVVWTVEEKKYYLDQSLDKIENGLPAGIFFRLNRQYLLHRQVITGFRREGNGKLAVLIRPTPSLPDSVTVSRTKAPAFKSWFRTE